MKKSSSALLKNWSLRESAALLIMPVDCESVREKLESLSVEKKIPVVTFNSDIVGSKRVCFVGMDNRKSGRTAAGLLGMLTRGKENTDYYRLL